MSSPDPRSHERIGGGVRNNNAVWDRVREDAVLAGNFSNFSQNPAIKQHLLGTGTTCSAEASPFSPVWGIGLRADDPEASSPRRWPENCFLGNALPTVRDAIPTSEAGLAYPDSSHQLCTPTSPTELTRFPQRRLALWLWPALAQVVLRSFRSVFPTSRRTTAQRS